MAKDKIADYDGATAGNNTDIGGISIAEGMLPSAVNNSMRELTRQLGAFADGTEGIDVLNLHDDDASASIKIQAPATVTTTTTFTLPDGDGTNGYALVTNGAGQLSWASAGGLANIVEDTTPQLGGTLDLNSQNITGTGNIDISGTVTADGLTVDGGNTLRLDAASGDDYLTIQQTTTDATIKANSAAGNANLQFFTAASGSSTQRVDIAYNGDISFYDSTGVTQGFFWDASTQRLGLGTTAPATPIHTYSTSTAINRFEVGSASDSGVRLMNTAGDYSIYTAGGSLRFADNNASEVMRFSSGNVGIGTAAPSYPLEVHGSSGQLIYAQATSGTAYVRVDSSNAGSEAIFWARATNTGNSVLQFGDPDDGDVGWIKYEHSSNAMAFRTNAAERMRIDSSGNVGIGEASPTRNLVIKDTDGQVDIGLVTSNTGVSALMFADTDDSNIGRIQYLHSTNDLTFTTNDSEAARIDSSQNFLVSKTAADISVVGVEARANGSLIATKDNDKPLLLNRLTSDGDLIELRKAGTVGGGIGIVNGNNPYIANDADNSGLQFGSGSITPFYDSAAQSNSVDLGSSSTKFKDAYFSGTVNATSYTGDGSSLTGIAAGATGGGSDEIFWENGQTVTTNYTISNGKNAMSAGPITINTGVTVTVGTGETWTVV